ncbi:MAG TPA: hypothetical protein DCR93_34780, partial [Cytophagales bacterium]|nr:hypothetical protein [Cytophagales bacterium]
MKHIYLTTLAVLLCLGSAFAQTDTLMQESFETDGSGGTRYTLSAAHANDGGFEDYWERGNDTDFDSFGMDMAPIAGEDGSNYIGAEDIDAAGITGGAVTLTFNSVTISNYENLAISFLLAANEVTNFDYATRSNGDYVLVEYQVDAGTFDTLAFFSTAFNASSQRLEWDTDGNGFGDSLTSGDFTQYSFNIPETGSTLNLRMSMRTDAGDEEIALDNFLVEGNLVVVAGDQDSEVVSATQPSAGTLAANTVTSEGSAASVFAFAIQDQGTADGLDTEVTQMVFNQATNNTVSDWSAIIGGAVLFDGGSEITEGYAATINANNITIAFDTAYTVTDNSTSNDLTLKIWLQETSAVEDGSVIAVEVPTSNPGWTADGVSGSIFTSTFGSAVTGNDFTLEVEATTFTFSYATSDFLTDTDTELTLSATNAFGAVAKNSHLVTLSKASGTGNLSSTAGLTQSLTNGTYTWTDLRYDAAEEMVLNANNDSASYSTNDTLTFRGSITGSTSLAIGDLAILGANTDGDDDFAFVTLVDLGEDTEIFFTDDEWNSSTLRFNTGEGFLSYNAPSGGVAAGTVIVINPADESASDGGTVVELNGNFSRGTGGDHLYAYQAPTYDADDSITVLYAHTHFETWFDSNIDGSGLKNDITAVSPFSSTLDNVEYNGSRSITKNGLFSNLSVASNYDTDNSVQRVFDTTPFTFLAADLDITSPSAQVIAGSIEVPDNIARDSAQDVFTVEITDNGGDGLDATLFYFPIVAGANNTSDWTQDIADVVVKEGGMEIADDYTVTIDETQIDIVFTTGYTFTDNTSTDLTLAVQVNGNPDLADSTLIVFEVSDDLLCWVFDGGGSNPDLTGSTITGTDQIIDVLATQFNLTQNTTTIKTDSAFSFTVEAVNGFGATDTEPSQTVSITLVDTAAGDLSAGGGLTRSLVDGVVTIDDLVFDEIGDFELRFTQSPEGFNTTSGTLSAVDGAVTSVFFTSTADTTGEADGSYTLWVSLEQADADTATSVDVVLVSGDTAGIGGYTTQTVTFPAGSDSTLSVTVTLTDDEIISGTSEYIFQLQNLVSTVEAQIVEPDSFNLTVLDNDFVVINEVDADQSGSDSEEFIELYDGGQGNVSLDGYVVVRYNGSDDRSYDDAISLDGQSTDANGYFVIGSSTVTNVDLVFADAENNVQNGADAVALYFGIEAADFGEDTDLDTSDALVDAIIYDTNDSDDSGLAPLLLAGSQINEDINGDKDNHSIQRLPNGAGGARDGSFWSADIPTPGTENVDSFLPGLVATSPFEGQTDVPTDNGLAFELTEAVTADEFAKILLLKNDGTGLAITDTILFGDPEVDIEGTTIEVTGLTFDAGTQYFVWVDSAAVSDASGNVNQEYRFEFFTAGDVPNLALVTDPFQSEVTLSFGRIDSGASEVRELVISGSNLVGDVNVSLDGDDPGMYLVGTDGSTFFTSVAFTPDGDRKVNDTLYVLFNPTECGELKALLVVNTLNGEQLTAKLGGSGSGASCADFFADTELLDFGVGIVGETSLKSLFVTGANIDTANITFTAGASGAFSIGLDTASLNTAGVSITSGNFTDTEVFLAFDPINSDIFQDTLLLSDASGEIYGGVVLRAISGTNDSIGTIAEARAASLEATIGATGVVIAANEFGGPAYIQDDSAGIAIFWEDLHEGVEIGDSILVVGERAEFFGLAQISGDEVYFSVIENVGAPTATEVDGADIGNHESRLVKVYGKFDDTRDLLYPESNYDFTTRDGTTIEIRIDGDTPFVGRTRPQDSVYVTAVVSQFSGTYQILPRFLDDMEGTEEYVAESGSSYPTANTLDVVSWNLEFFGSTVDGFGADDKDLQLINTKTIIEELDADIIAVQEVSNTQTLASLANLLGWESVCSDVYSFSFNGPDPDFPAQRLCYLYDPATTTLLDEFVMFEDFYNAERLTPDLLASHPGGSAQSFWSSGRLPYAARFQANNDGSSGEVLLVNIHAKSGSGSNDIDRKEFDANVLYDSLQEYFPDENIIILGDFNDDLDVSIDGSSVTPYNTYLTDSSGFFAPSKDLSDAGLRTFIFNTNVIDHQVFSDELEDAYLDGSVEVFIPFDVVDDYSGTTSDHLPVVTRIDFTPFLLEFASSDAFVTEGDADTVTIYLEFEPSPTERTATITLDYNNLVQDEDVDVFDADTTSLTVTLPAFDTTASFSVAILDDMIVEANDTIFFVIDSSADYTVGDNDLIFIVVEDDDSVSVEFELATDQVTEGEVNVPVTLVLATAAEVDLEVEVDVNPISADTADFASVTFPYSATIAAGDTTATFEFDVTDDTEIELDETFEFTITDASDVVYIGSISESEITITDNDFVEVEFSATANTVVEGTNDNVVTVELSQSVSFDVEVTVGVEDVTTVSSDYVLPDTFPITLTIEAGNPSAFFQYEVTDDSDTEDDESFLFVITDVEAPATIGDTDTLVITVEANDPLPTEVSFADTAATVSEGDSAVILTLDILNPSDEFDTEVEVKLLSGSLADVEGIEETTTVTFPAGSSASKTITVLIKDDEDVEDTETLLFSINAVSGGTEASAGEPNSFYLTITDNDTVAVNPTEVTFTTENLSATEGTDSTVTLSLTIANPNADTATTVEVVITGGSASDVGDYTTQTVTFPAGSTDKQTVTVSITDDSDVENDEVVSFSLDNISGGNGAFIGESDVVNLVISDNDSTSTNPTSVEFALSEQAEDEDEGTIYIPVSITNPSDSVATTVEVILSEGDTSNLENFTEPITVTFAAGSSEFEFVSLTLADNDDVDGSRSLEFKLQNVSGGNSASLGTNVETVLTIEDDDTVATGTTEVFLADTELTVEEDEGKVYVEVRIVNPNADTATTVELALTSGDAADVDSYATQTVTFDAGESDAKFVAIEITDDIKDEDDEAIVFTLQNISGGNGAAIIDPDTFTLTIEDNDLPTTEVSLAISEDTVAEDAGTVTVTVNIANPSSDEATTVELALTSGDAEDVDNYTTQTVTFAAGDSTAQTVTINVTDDSTSEDAETFIFELQNVSGGANAILTSGATEFILTIEANDPLPTTEVSLDASTATVAEDAGTVSVIVNITDPSPDEATTVELVLTSGDTADIGGYTTQMVTFPAGSDSAQVVTITITDDAVEEDDEDFTFELQNVNGGTEAILGSPATFTLTVEANDLPTTVVSLTSVASAVSEGVGTVNVTVGITDPSPTEATTVELALTAGDAADLGNYTTQTVTFEAGSTTTQSFSITVTDDEDMESDESFTFELQNPTGGTSAILGNATTYTLSVLDNDVVDTTVVSFASTTGTVAEDGGSVTLTLNIENPADEATTVEVSISSGDAADVDNFTTQTVTFPAGSNGDQTLTVNITDNDVDEADASVTFALGNATTSSSSYVATVGDNGTFTLTITDEDE